MSGKRNLPTSDPEEESGFTRRTFVQFGAAGLAIAASGSLRPLKAGTSFNAAPKTPRIGAIYNCGYRWDGTGWQGIRAVSALGRYDSGDVGAIDTHLVWAKNWGMSFFLALSETDEPDDYRTRNIAKLFDRAEMNDFDVAVMLAYDARKRPANRRVSGADWLNGRLRAVKSSGILKRKGYLRTTDGRPIVAIRSENPSAAADAVGNAASGDVWLWVVSEAQAPPSFNSMNAAWVAPALGAAPRFAAIRRGRKVDLLQLPANGGAEAVTPAQLSAYGGSSYIVVNSFNDWSHQPTVEPTSSDRSQAVYLASLRKQIGNLTR
jgi:hypothetical protein